MKVMVIMKGDPTPDQQPTAEIFRMMMEFNLKLAEAGVLVGVGGLYGSFDAKRVELGADGPSIVDGPFAETKELVSGFWILSVADWDEAVEWFAGSPLAGFGLEVELRRVGEPSNFDPAYFTPDLHDLGARLRELVRANLDAADERASRDYLASLASPHGAAIADR